MISIAYNIYKKWIWLTRIRHRRGYGVHSPFAFDFIQDVIYNRERYYVYAELEEKRRKCPSPDYRHTKKLDGLLFRVANFVRPETLLVYGAPDGLSVEYLRAGCRNSKWLSWDDTDVIGLLYIGDIQRYAEVFDKVVSRITPQSVLMVAGIHRSKKCYVWWRKIQTDDRVGITFDLYDLGVVFFDRSRHKQHYKVNF